MRTDLLSKKLKIKEQNIIAHINKNFKIFNDLGVLIEKFDDSKLQGGRPKKYYDLNDNQVKFIILLIKNDNESILLKKQILLNEFDIEIFKKETKKGYVYIIKNKNGDYKIGCTISPDKRIRNIETQQGEKVEIILISHLTIEYKNLENKLHYMFKDKRILGEYFKLDKNDINKITMEILKVNENEFNYIEYMKDIMIYKVDKNMYFSLYMQELYKILDKKKKTTNLKIYESSIEFAKYIIISEFGNNPKNIDESKMQYIYKQVEENIIKIVSLINENAFEILNKKINMDDACKNLQNKFDN